MKVELESKFDVGDKIYYVIKRNDMWKVVKGNVYGLDIVYVKDNVSGNASGNSVESRVDVSYMVELEIKDDKNCVIAFDWTLYSNKSEAIKEARKREEEDEQRN